MTLVRRILLAGGCVALLAPSVSAADKTVSQDTYQSLIRKCRSFLSQREIEPDTAKKLADQLRSIKRVTLPAGQTLSVDTKPEADALDAISGTTPDKKLQERFAALEDQLTTDTPISTKNDPHGIAEKILDAQEFATSKPKTKGKGWDGSFLPAWMKPIARVLQPILEWLGNVFGQLGKWLSKSTDTMLRGIGTFFRWIFNKFPQNKWRWNPKNPFASLGNGVLLTLYFLATVGAVVALYFLSRYLFDLYEVRTGRKRKAVALLGGDLDLSDEGITDPLATAKERASQGDYRAAIRLTYIASLWKLGEAGILLLEKNHTNWEYQRALLRKSKSLHDDLLPATRLFDRVWYGKQKATEREFQTVSAIYDALPTQDIVPSSVTIPGAEITSTPTGATP